MARPETPQGNPNAIERAVIKKVHRDVPEKLARERAIVVPSNREEYVKGLRLEELGDDHRIRHNSQGEIFIDRYYDGPTPKILIPNKGFDIGFDSIESFDRRWIPTGDVENSIRYSKHIADNYDRKQGKEALSLVAVHRAIKSVSQQLQKPIDERLPWEEIQQRAYLAIDSAGFNDAKDEDKIALRNAIADAVKKDKKGRENPARTRLMLAHLYPFITRMILKNEIKANKYRYAESILYQERARDRMPLEEFIANVRELEKMSANNAERERFKKRIRRVAHTSFAPTRIRVAPYVQVAAVSRYLLFGRNTSEELEKLTGYIGPELAQETVEVASYYDFKEYKDQLKRLKAVADFVEASLEEADGNLPQLEQAA